MNTPILVVAERHSARYLARCLARYLITARDSSRGTSWDILQRGNISRETSPVGGDILQDLHQYVFFRKLGHDKKPTKTVSRIVVIRF